MLVKKLKSGKLRVELDLHVRNDVFYCLVNILEGTLNWVDHNRLKKEDDIYRYLIHSTLNTLAVRPNWFLNSFDKKRILITRPEAVALMWVLRDESNMQLLNLKSALHKSLI